MKVRYETLDFIRGFTILNMIAFHILFDLKYIFGVEIQWFGSDISLWWQTIGCMVFMMISGSLSGSSRLLKRGFYLLFLGICFSFVTWMFFPEAVIVFGILHFFGVSMIITAVIMPFIKKIPEWPGLIISLALFFVTRLIFLGHIFLPFIGKVLVPSDLYKTEFLFFMGFPHKGFISSDYFPLLPWYFSFLAGYFLFKILTKKGDKRYFHFEFKPINYIGKKSLLIYIIHQPIILLICFILFDKIL